MAQYLDDTTTSELASRLQPAPGPAAGGDDLDDLFNYDVIGDDPFDEPLQLSNRSVPAPAESASRSRGSRGGAGLGLDEAVDVTGKIRAPKPKLDENRLLSNAGIPKLRQKAKNLRLKGKGHEYSDATRLLQMYQIWLDDLFPKAEFLDALNMVEKQGHKRQMQSMRMEWINEGKPRDTLVEEDPFSKPLDSPSGEPGIQTASRVAPIFEKNSTETTRTSSKDPERPQTPEAGHNFDDDIYDATPVQQKAAPVRQSIFGPGVGSAPADDEMEDDLDALLAEDETEGRQVSRTVQSIQRAEPDFDDEMEAMAEMEGMW